MTVVTAEATAEAKTVGATEAGATKAGVEGKAEVATAVAEAAEAEVREASRRPSGRALTHSAPPDDVREIVPRLAQISAQPPHKIHAGARRACHSLCRMLRRPAAAPGVHCFGQHAACVNEVVRRRGRHVPAL